MNNQNLSTNQLHWIAPRPTAPGQFVPTENTKENHLDKAYVTSIRGVLKFACLVRKQNERRINVFLSDSSTRYFSYLLLLLLFALLQRLNALEIIFFLPQSSGW